MKTCLYFQSPSKTSAPEKLAGVQEIMDRKSIHLQVIEEPPTRELVSDLADFWNPIGAIVDCGREYNQIDTGIFSGITTVFLSHDPKTIPESCRHVFHDQRLSARLAARELLETGFDNFAYVPFAEGTTWSDERGRTFSRAIALNGKKCAMYHPPTGRTASGASSNPTATNRINALMRFLKSQRKPCAVFAANDIMAEAVLSAAQLADLSVPDEIAVIGVDNYEPICEHTSPPLSSIEPDFRRGGNLAALMLLAAGADDGRKSERTATFGPLRVVRRASSRILLRQDAHVAAALDLIRREACTGLTAGKVTALFPCSRRMADLRFFRATGHTILDEIHIFQIERAKQLVEDGSMPLKAISDFCGFTNPNSLRKFFLKSTGTTMSEWRRRASKEAAAHAPRSRGRLQGGT